jgi:hypothetical protein
MGKRRVFRWVIGLALAAVVCFGVLVASVWGTNWLAERRARRFCSMIPIGSDIAAATATATKRRILWGSYGGYTFYFPGVIFDKAVCEVSVSKEGKVLSRNAEMEYD